MRSTRTFTVTGGPDGERRLVLGGREAAVMAALVANGRRGLTAEEEFQAGLGLRLAVHIARLRTRRIAIETQRPHGQRGAGRYVLNTPAIVDDARA